MSTNRPTGITVDRKAAEMKVGWSDGHLSTYPFSLLRYGCPCAECRGGHDKMGGAPPPEIFYMPLEDSPRTHLLQVEPVGSYGITIRWEDGHHFGIYTWDYLRALCPCDECRAGVFYG
jgi:DUF971 family protein